MNSIGETLRRERLRRNLDLERVSRETKINVRMLEAIEAEDYGKLPGGVFTKSFVRQYARILGLDEDEIVGELQRNLQPPPESEQTEDYIPVESPIEVPRLPDWNGIKQAHSGSSLPALALVVVVMLLCSAIYGWWQKSRHTVPVAQQVVQQAPPQVPVPASPPRAAAVQPPAATQAPPQPPAPEPASATPAPENPNVAVHVLLSADEATWVSARLDGKVVFSGTLQPNEKKDLAAVSEIRLVVGNAGGIAIVLNGKPVPPIGPRGQVRVVQLSPGGVQIVPRKPEPDAL